MWMHEYVAEKLRELELERPYVTPPFERRRRKPVFGSTFRVTGRALRRIGEGLESWATPCTPSEEERYRFEERYET
jgi:hypothetical protein